jgi:hypothetical protein
MMTSHGRATPLIWKTHEKSKLRKHRNDYEDELLAYFREILQQNVKATVLADRGLMEAFGRIVHERAVCHEIFGVI